MSAEAEDFVAPIVAELNRRIKATADPERWGTLIEVRDMIRDAASKHYGPSLSAREVAS